MHRDVKEFPMSFQIVAPQEVNLVGKFVMVPVKISFKNTKYTENIKFSVVLFNGDEPLKYYL